MSLTFLLYPIAVFYFAEATVISSTYIVDRLEKDSWFKRRLNDKPFSCAFCMCIWWSIILFFMPLVVVKIIAIAGTAYIISSLISRLNTIFLRS